MKIVDVISYLEEEIPLCYQEDYDNCGLLVGDSNNKLSNILIALDCTEEVVDEAIRKKSNLIITHHPVIFDRLKKVTTENHVGRTILKAIKNDIAIYALHTNLDNVLEGVNSKIAEKIGLQDFKILFPKKELLMQLVVYVPKKEAKKVRESLFDAGAGSIGKYGECSFNFEGEGTFKPYEGATPSVGKMEERHIEKEECISVVFPKNLRYKVVQAMQNSHPYEEIAYQLYILDNVNQNVGSGIIGKLPKKIKTTEFLALLKSNMDIQCLRHSPLVKKDIKKIAICGGSGSFLINEAKCIGADIFITSDVKYHDFFLAENDLIIVDIGHYESEQFTKELICDILIKKFPKFAPLLSGIKTNPINYL